MTIQDEFTIDEWQHIEKFRKLFKGKMNDDMYNDLNMFKRFLIARDFNIAAAEAMLEKHLNWRKIVNFDVVTANYKPPEVLRYFSWNSLGYDKEGYPIIYCPFGQIDLRGLLRCIPKSERIKHLINIFEDLVLKMKKQSLRHGKVIDAFVVIFDFDNFSILNATHKPMLETMIQFVGMYNDNYPERLKTCFLINTSFAFSLYWSVIKNFLTGRTIQKMKVFGRDGYSEEFLKTMDSEVLPKSLGGTRTDPDGNPMCKTIFSYGGKIPEHFYVRRMSITTTLTNLKKLTVPRRSKAEVTVEVKVPGSHIEWVFETKSRDIGFSLLFKENKNFNDGYMELLPKHRVDSESTTEPRLFTCDQAGFYILQFDNSYSWLHPKEIFYSLKVKSPINELNEVK